jgi:ABC-type cobalt transport system, ATPase component
MTYAIEVQDAYYRYLSSKDFVLKGINLKVKRGEFVSVMGPTGAGKSTLCLTLNGIIPHFLGGELVGQVRILGRDTRCCDVSELAQKVGLVFEEPESQLFCTSVEDEVAFGPENLGIPPTEIRKRIDWALQVVRMIEYKHKPPFKLSGGQKQRVAIAAALSMLPEILVLDEPISGLDPIGKMEVLSVLGDLKKRQEMTIIMVEHESEEIAKFSDRVMVLDEGKIISDGGTEGGAWRRGEIKESKIVPSPGL